MNTKRFRRQAYRAEARLGAAEISDMSAPNKLPGEPIPKRSRCLGAR